MRDEVLRSGAVELIDSIDVWCIHAIKCVQVSNYLISSAAIITMAFSKGIKIAIARTRRASAGKKRQRRRGGGGGGHLFILIYIYIFFNMFH